MALSKVPVAVVCAGVKSILDIGRTLEYLETQGVPVLTFGQERAFPSFFTADSGHKAPHNVASYLEAARVIGWQLMITGAGTAGRNNLLVLAVLQIPVWSLVLEVVLCLVSAPLLLPPRPQAGQVGR